MSAIGIDGERTSGECVVRAINLPWSFFTGQGRVSVNPHGASRTGGCVAAGACLSMAVRGNFWRVLELCFGGHVKGHIEHPMRPSVHPDDPHTRRNTGACLLNGKLCSQPRVPFCRRFTTSPAAVSTNFWYGVCSGSMCSRWKRLCAAAPHRSPETALCVRLSVRCTRLPHAAFACFWCRCMCVCELLCVYVSVDCGSAGESVCCVCFVVELCECVTVTHWLPVVC